MLLQAKKIFNGHSVIRNGSRFFINPRSLDSSIIIPFQEIVHLAANDLLNEVEKVLQSRTELDVSDLTFTIDVEDVRIPYGDGRNGSE